MIAPKYLYWVDVEHEGPGGGVFHTRAAATVRMKAMRSMGKESSIYVTYNIEWEGIDDPLDQEA